jgi:hypothetical protein
MDLRPEMTFTSTIIIAITSRIWIRPPMVYEETIPNSQSTIRTTQIVQSMTSPLFFRLQLVALATAVAAPCYKHLTDSIKPAGAGLISFEVK